LNGVAARALPNDIPANAERCARVFALSGSVVVPVSLDAYEDAKVQLGVIVDGVQMPTPGNSRIVNVCISGLCVARVRPRGNFFQSYQFMSAPVRRDAGDTDAKLTGAGESSSCGTHRVIAFLNEPDANGIDFAAVLL
jgi:hypothetical protein